MDIFKFLWKSTTDLKPVPKIKMDSSKPLKKYDLDGKVALVTGSSAGIGAAIALKFAENGAKVVITGRNQKALDMVAKKICDETGHQPLKVVGNMLDEPFAPLLIKAAIGHFGHLDILVNNAGTGFPFDTLTNENLIPEFDKLMALNVRAPLRLIQLSMEYLAENGGNVINISSNASFEPILFTYSVSKAALDMLTKGAAQELGPKGVRVNSINPGPTITSMGRAIGEDANYFEKNKQQFGRLTALNRVPYPEEMANLACFLASDDAKNITGSIIVSDGGMLVKKRQHFSKSS